MDSSTLHPCNVSVGVGSERKHVFMICLLNPNIPSPCIALSRRPAAVFTPVTQATRDHAGAGVRPAGHQPRGAARAETQGSQVRAPALAHLRIQVGDEGGQSGIELETKVTYYGLTPIYHSVLSVKAL